MSFAENLKQIRKDRNLSQEELAEIMDVSRQAVSKWENAWYKKLPSIHLIWCRQRDCFFLGRIHNLFRMVC